MTREMNSRGVEFILPSVPASIACIYAVVSTCPNLAGIDAFYVKLNLCKRQSTERQSKDRYECHIGPLISPVSIEHCTSRSGKFTTSTKRRSSPCGARGAAAGARLALSRQCRQGVPLGQRSVAKKGFQKIDNNRNAQSQPPLHRRPEYL